MSRPLNTTEKAQLRAMIARTSRKEVLEIVSPALVKFFRGLAGFTPYEYPEGESWTDDQAEDAIVWE